MARFIYVIIVVGSIFSGTLSSDFFIYGINPYQIIIFYLFISTSIPLIYKGKIKYNIIDKIFTIYIVVVCIIPVLINIVDIVNYNGNIQAVLLPIKIYFIYRILYNIKCIYKNDVEYEFYLNILIIFTVIAALFGFLRYLSVPIFTDFINNIWPIDQGRGTDIFESARLESTMSGTNGAATYFATIAIISFYRYLHLKKAIYLISYLFLLSTVFLTGSLTAGILSLLFLIYIVFKYIKFKTYILLLISIVAILATILSIDQTKIAVERIMTERINNNLLQNRNQGIYMPKTFESRYSRWDGQLSHVRESLFFGHASQTNKNKIPSSVLTHNYYVFLAIYSGMIGLVTYFIVMIMLLYKIIKIKHLEYFVIIILFILVAQITQLTSNYGGISELLGILLFINKSYLVN